MQNIPCKLLTLILGACLTLPVCAEEIPMQIPMYADYCITSGNIYVTVITEEGAKDSVGFTSNEAAIKVAAIDEADDFLLRHGQDIHLTLDIRPEQYENVKDVVEAVNKDIAASDKKQVAFDITVTKKKSERESNMSTVNDKLSFSVKVPDDLDKTRTDQIKLIHVHKEEDGSFNVSTIPVEYQADTQTVLFSTAKFSAFVLSYPIQQKAAEQAPEKTPETPAPAEEPEKTKTPDKTDTQAKTETKKTTKHKKTASSSSDESSSDNNSEITEEPYTLVQTPNVQTVEPTPVIASPRAPQTSDSTTPWQARVGIIIACVALIIAVFCKFGEKHEN